MIAMWTDNRRNDVRDNDVRRNDYRCYRSNNVRRATGGSHHVGARRLWIGLPLGGLRLH